VAVLAYQRLELSPQFACMRRSELLLAAHLSSRLLVLAPP
jgi:hypothetical protein